MVKKIILSIVILLVFCMPTVLGVMAEGTTYSVDRFHWGSQGGDEEMAIHEGIRWTMTYQQPGGRGFESSSYEGRLNWIAEAIDTRSVAGDGSGRTEREKPVETTPAPKAVKASIFDSPIKVAALAVIGTIGFLTIFKKEAIRGSLKRKRPYWNP